MKTTDYSSRAIVVLASYDFEVLQITLWSLSHTISQAEKVVIVLNGSLGIYASRTETVAREWAMENPRYRKIVKPFNFGGSAYYSIKEVLENFDFLEDVEYICKIDDDIIPLKLGWLDSLAFAYKELSQKEDVAFVSGLINNNTWGARHIIDIFGKQGEYQQIMNMRSYSFNSSGLIPPGALDEGRRGSLWCNPYVALWLHTWTTLDLAEFIVKTENLEYKRIAPEIYYSIGCIFFQKKIWQEIESENTSAELDDEALLHNYCLSKKLSKWAVMSEPIVHLFYYTQRAANKDLLQEVANSFSVYFNDPIFTEKMRWITVEDRLVNLEEKMILKS